MGNVTLIKRDKTRVLQVSFSHAKREKINYYNILFTDFAHTSFLVKFLSFTTNKIISRKKSSEN